ncbi:hypothetical protein DB721_02040 [Helicobacter pylori]|uniref:Uncharacterized protein n=1 Tax=Helicobacter pylori TaxID=210 RepID=A0A7Z6SS97_HELPX|nr:hypothetical protein DB721_02040 [Helicobacter pylori]
MGFLLSCFKTLFCCKILKEIGGILIILPLLTPPKTKPPNPKRPHHKKSSLAFRKLFEHLF